MRRAGSMGLDRSPGSRVHLCCRYDDVAEFHAHVSRFLTEGLRDGLRVAYAGIGGPEAARADLAGIDDLDRLLDEGAVETISAEDLYQPGKPVDAERVVASYAAATEQALADGFRGLRVSADATTFVRTPEQHDAFARYEFLVDRYMAGHPLSAMCGFRHELGEDAVTEFACLHSGGGRDMPGFRVFGCADGAVGLAGEFDQGTVPVLARMLPVLRTDGDGSALVVDLAEVEYLDHRLLLTLDDYARTMGVDVSARSIPPFATRLMHLVPVSNLRPAEAGNEP